MRCSHRGCSWRSIAPSTTAAAEQYADHLVTAHATTVDADIPDGMVQIKLGSEGDWVTTTPEEAFEIHERLHPE